MAYPSPRRGWGGALGYSDISTTFVHRLCIFWGIQIVEFHYFGFECNVILFYIKFLYRDTCASNLHVSPYHGIRISRE